MRKDDLIPDGLDGASGSWKPITRATVYSETNHYIELARYYGLIVTGVRIVTVPIKAGYSWERSWFPTRSWTNCRSWSGNERNRFGLGQVQGAIRSRMERWFRRAEPFPMNSGRIGRGRLFSGCRRRNPGSWSPGCGSRRPGKNLIQGRIREMIREELAALFPRSQPRPADASAPRVTVLWGVNGSGKTDGGEVAAAARRRERRFCCRGGHFPRRHLISWRSGPGGWEWRSSVRNPVPIPRRWLRRPPCRRAQGVRPGDCGWRGLPPGTI